MHTSVLTPAQDALSPMLPLSRRPVPAFPAGPAVIWRIALARDWGGGFAGRDGGYGACDAPRLEEGAFVGGGDSAWGGCAMKVSLGSVGVGHLWRLSLPSGSR